MIDGITALDMTRQQALRLNTGRDMVLLVMSDGEARTLWQIQDAVAQLPGGQRFSESTIGARIRDLRKAEFGGHTVNSRIREGSSRIFEYWLEG